MSSAPASSERTPSHLPEYIQERLNQQPQLQAKQVPSPRSLLYEASPSSQSVAVNNQTCSAL